MQAPTLAIFRLFFLCELLPREFFFFFFEIVWDCLKILSACDPKWINAKHAVIIDQQIVECILQVSEFKRVWASFGAHIFECFDGRPLNQLGKCASATARGIKKVVEHIVVAPTFLGQAGRYEGEISNEGFHKACEGDLVFVFLERKRLKAGGAPFAFVGGIDDME